ncbi:hypothetical protein FOFC_01910 [Fusarium oxysporum]|nr:hypothetical protein FOFC_01910 [Fusarium oxysporum]
MAEAPRSNHSSYCMCQSFENQSSPVYSRVWMLHPANLGLGQPHQGPQLAV